MRARLIAARVVQKGPVARASLSRCRASRVRDKRLRGQSHVPASSAQARLHPRANSAENEIISAPKKPWIKGADSRKVTCDQRPEVSRLRINLRRTKEV